ncbi:unnamed protein product, partial [Polarella glacialis]
ATALGAACAGCTGGALLPWAAGGSFLVSGGLSGLGLVSALALREAGATSLALLSRSGAARAGRSAQLLEELRAGPGQLEIHLPCCDVADKDALAAIALRRPDFFLGSPAGGRPCGVLHTAGALADALLSDLRQRHFAATFGPKVMGALHLFEAAAAALSAQG